MGDFLTNYCGIIASPVLSGKGMVLLIQKVKRKCRDRIFLNCQVWRRAAILGSPQGKLGGWRTGGRVTLVIVLHVHWPSCATQQSSGAFGCLAHIHPGGVGARALWGGVIQCIYSSATHVLLCLSLTGTKCTSSEVFPGACRTTAAIFVTPWCVRRAWTCLGLAHLGVAEAHACVLTALVFSLSLPPCAEYIQKYATEEALKEQEEGTGDSSSESSMSDFSEDEAQDMEL